MTNLKDKATAVLYFHHHVLVTMILCLGGLFSLCLIYLFLFTSASIDRPQEDTATVSIKQEALDRVLLFGKQKKDQSNVFISVPNEAFAVPVVAP